MPELTIYKDAQFRFIKNYVWPTWQLGVEAVAMAKVPYCFPEDQFRPCILRPDFTHLI
jgi:hypothetical protein